MRILVVDDVADIQVLLVAVLQRAGFEVIEAADGTTVESWVEDARPDLIILDLMMPGEDGLSICRRLRADTAIPIIMLTALGEETDRIVGLEMGADDYLAKPFNPRELLARIKAVLRRAKGRSDTGVADGGPVLGFAGWRLNVEKRELQSPDSVMVPLSGGEFDLLAAFVTHPGRVLSRDQLLDLARGREAQPFDRSIDVQVSRLRRKIEVDPRQPALIKTVRGGGYMFSSSVDRQEERR